MPCYAVGHGFRVLSVDIVGGFRSTPPSGVVGGKSRILIVPLRVTPHFKGHDKTKQMVRLK